MCTWVGYTGKDNAAEITLNMLKKIETLWSGYFSGLVTCNENGLHYGKRKGNLKRWQEIYSPSQFPGRSALFHSRTGGIGGDETAHPYLAPNDQIAVVSQGSRGIFEEECITAIQQAGNRLLACGARFPSASSDRPHVILMDGNGVCMSEIVVFRVAEEYQKNHDPVCSIRIVATEIPEESVSGFLFADYPECLFFVNTTQSLMVGKGTNGMYCATTSLAFPDEVNDVTQLPFNSISKITPEGWQSETLAPRYDKMAEIPEKLAEEAFLSFLKANPGARLADVADKVLRPLCRLDDGFYPRAVTAYRLLEKFHARGRLRLIPINEEQSGLVITG